MGFPVPRVAGTAFKSIALYGYMSFRVDATDFVKPGQLNVLAVQVDTRQHNSRW
jgi:hypothetical protein